MALSPIRPNRYDGALQMWVNAPRDADKNHLIFYRKMAKKEHRAVGIPVGEYAQADWAVGVMVEEFFSDD